MIHKTNSDDVEELAKVYNQELSKIYNEACPIITKIARKSSKPWYDLELKDMKKCLIEKERAWKANIYSFHVEFLEFRRKYHKMIKLKRDGYYNSLLEENKKDTKELFKIINKMTDSGKNPEKKFYRPNTTQKTSQSCFESTMLIKSWKSTKK